MKAEQIKQKAKPKKALFLINNNEVNTLHYVERILDVSMTISAEGISFNATEDDVYFVLTEIETNPRIAERLKLKPLEYNNLGVIDISLIDILVAYDGGIKKVNFNDDDLIRRKYD